VVVPARFIILYPTPEKRRANFHTPIPRAAQSDDSGHLSQRPVLMILFTLIWICFYRGDAVGPATSRRGRDLMPDEAALKEMVVPWSQFEVSGGRDSGIPARQFLASMYPTYPTTIAPPKVCFDTHG
jgi:hypothetical protein